MGIHRWEDIKREAGVTDVHGTTWSPEIQKEPPERVFLTEGCTLEPGWTCAKCGTCRADTSNYVHTDLKARESCEACGTNRFE